ncbi:MAG TPA: flavin-dependent oxidoreductase [Polyangiaceae bacterium]|nr:flavin-dependent oxidoreductase [Polyangiaceae bacterium]
MRALIVGGGIGGLAAALSLHEAGFDVDVYESVRELRPLGVGINLLPHAVRELYELGLESALAADGVMPSQLVYYSKRGHRIWGEPRGIQAGYRWPQISIHRGRLHMLLYRVVRDRLGADRVHLGHHLEAFEGTRDGVRCRFVDRSNGSPLGAAEGDVLVGCDGIHSTVRARLNPEEGRPAWNGALMWRGVTSGAPFLDGRSMIMAGHAKQKFVAYPIDASVRAGAAINWVAEIHYPASHPVEPEDWNRAGRLDDFLPAFDGWRFDWLDVPDLVRRAEAVYVYPMVDRDPLARWGHDRVTLLGDAAHPMYPIGSNGASQAILDACVLAGCLRSRSDPSVALGVYEEIRRPATSAIVLANRKQGPEECMTLVEQRAPDGFARVEDVVSREELRAISEKYKRLCGFSVDELNDRPSLRHAAY